MTRVLTRLGTTALTVLLLLLAAQRSSDPLAAQSPQGLEEDDTALGISHVDCRFFGEDRDMFLKTGLGASLMAMTQQSQLTTEVVAALSTIPGTGRGRVGSLAQQGSQASIDDYLFSTMQAQGIPPAGMTTDSEFLRRVTLDLTGRIPSAQEVIDFLSDPSADKRVRAIDRLLDTPQWADRWAMFFGDLYRNTVRTAQVNRYLDGRDAFHLFLRDSLLENKPYDQMVREMLTASGPNDGRDYPLPFSSYEEYLAISEDYEGNPVTPTPVSYLVGGRIVGGPIHDTYDGMAVNLARDFLALSHMDCILCHDGAGHLDSLSVWGASAKRLEGWQLAAFFSRTVLFRPPVPPPSEGERPARPRWWVVLDPPRTRPYRLNTTTGNRPARQPSDADGLEVVTPRYPFGGGEPAAGESYREALGRLLTEDPQFSRAIVNYAWKHFFSRGLVEPADQFDLARLDPGSPPPEPWQLQSPHVQLLDKLAQDFAANGFDLKWLMRQITNSAAYQLSSRYEGAWSPSYEEFFARHAVRRLSAEELHDALVLSSGVVQPYPVSRALGGLVFAMQFPDVQFVPLGGRRADPQFNASAAATSFLDAFLRGDRENTPRSSEASIMQALQLMNSPLVLDRVQASRQDGVLSALLTKPDDELVAALYVLVLSRFPTPEELAAGVDLLAAGDRETKAEDLMWSLYNKVDFIFNY